MKALSYLPRAVAALAAMALVTTAANAATIAQREIQFASVDFTSGVVELHNYGAASVDLSGWRFCSHDEDQVRRYTGGTGFNGTTILGGQSLFVHWNNDASGANAVNASALGGSVAQTLDSGSFGLQIYFSPVSFGNGNTIADHIQWSIDGIDNTSADERSDEAEAGGVWTDQSLWIATSADSARIDLLDTTGAELHSPANYAVSIPEPSAFTLLALGLVGVVLRRRR